jgi:hypothetical protein
MNHYKSFSRQEVRKMEHMKSIRSIVSKGAFFALAVMIVLAIAAGATFAHCDTMKGPVIFEAKAALEKGDITPILKWVKKENETEIKKAFAKAIAVRAKGPEAKELADQYFIETLVRVHRAGEGAPYTGIKDEPVEPIVALSDKALADGSPDELIKKVNSHVAEGIQEKFNAVMKAKKDKDKSVEAGREYVEAYVIYTHYVENIHAAVMSSPVHHHGAPGEAKAKGEAHGEHKH